VLIASSRAYIEEGKDGGRARADGLPRNVVRPRDQLVDTNAYKRKQAAAPGPRHAGASGGQAGSRSRAHGRENDWPYTYGGRASVTVDARLHAGPAARGSPDPEAGRGLQGPLGDPGRVSRWDQDLERPCIRERGGDAPEGLSDSFSSGLWKPGRARSRGRTISVV